MQFIIDNILMQLHNIINDDCNNHNQIILKRNFIIDNFGFIIVDQLLSPIDDEHDILEILKIVKS